MALAWISFSLLSSNSFYIFFGDAFAWCSLWTRFTHHTLEMSWLNINIAVVWYSILYTHNAITSSCVVYFMEFEFPKVSMCTDFQLFDIHSSSFQEVHAPNPVDAVATVAASDDDGDDRNMLHIEPVIFELLTFHSTYILCNGFTDLNSPSIWPVRVCVRAKSLPYTHAHPQISDESHAHVHRVCVEWRMHGVKSQSTIRADTMRWISSHRDTKRFYFIFCLFFQPL